MKRLISLMIAVLFLSACKLTSTIEGQVFWHTSEEKKPMAGAIVELHTAGPGKTQVINTATTDEQGYYVFENIQFGEYLIPIVMWESQDTSNPCPRGNPWGVMGGWVDTTSEDVGLLSLGVAGIAVDTSGVEKEASAAREKGIPWVGWAISEGKTNVAVGETAEKEIKFSCR